MKLYFDILDEKRQEVLPYLEAFKEEFYLAGGTALALQFGHRDSQDFDFFSPNSFDTRILFEKVRKHMGDFQVRKIQDEEDTLSVLLDEEVKLSFFAYNYPMLVDPIETDYLNLASLKDIACMKLASITHRSTVKDYIDLYFLMRRFPLSELFILVKQKYDNHLDSNLILKSLVYFEDIPDKHIIETMKYCHDKEITFDQVKSFILKAVKKYMGKRYKLS